MSRQGPCTRERARGHPKEARLTSLSQQWGQLTDSLACCCVDMTSVGRHLQAGTMLPDWVGWVCRSGRAL